MILFWRFMAEVSQQKAKDLGEIRSLRPRVEPAPIDDHPLTVLVPEQLERYGF